MNEDEDDGSCFIELTLDDEHDTQIWVHHLGIKTVNPVQNGCGATVLYANGGDVFRFLVQEPPARIMDGVSYAHKILYAADGIQT